MGGILPVPDEQTIERTWFLLDNDGYFNDESSGLGATVLKHHLGQVEAALRTRGYCGPALATIASPEVVEFRVGAEVVIGVRG